MKSPTVSRFFILLLALSLAGAAQASTSNKWRLQFSGGADSDGTIVFLVTPKGSAEERYSVDIEDGRSENGVAKDVVSALREQMPEDHYHIERDDGEDVLIKRRRGTANFGIEIESNTVEGVRINRDKE